LKRYESIHLEYWPEVKNEFIDEKLLEEFQHLLLVRDDVLKALENARASDIIGHSLDAHVLIEAKNPEILELMVKYRTILDEFFIVSKVSFVDRLPESSLNGQFVNVYVEHADGKKCQRCWKYSPETGSNESYPETCPRCSAVLKGERK
ncbi:MAG: zinc finger domain-containing protein, partial [Fervidobacterium sp.]